MEQTTKWPPARTAWFVALMLMLANTLAFVDRQALALLIEPIKQDLGLSDTAASLLYGLSFTLFYVLAGLPVARRRVPSRIGRARRPRSPHSTPGPRPR